VIIPRRSRRRLVNIDKLFQSLSVEEWSERQIRGGRYIQHRTRRWPTLHVCAQDTDAAAHVLHLCDFCSAVTIPTPDVDQQDDSGREHRRLDAMWEWKTRRDSMDTYLAED
jgi:hypothetical protein